MFGGLNNIHWIPSGNAIGCPGQYLFTFDKKKVYNLFKDYLWKLTPEEKEVFDRENQYWADFFKDRS